MSLLVCLALVFSAAAWIVVSCRWIFGVGVPGSVVGLVVGCALYVALCVTVRTDEASSRMMVVVPQTQARFEPDEKAAEYFVLAGGDIVAREKASGDWVRVRRNDGRPGWVSDGAVRKL